MQIKPTDIHIINGESAAGSWKQAFKGVSGLLIQRDILSFGPAPYCEDIKQWQNIRTSFLQNLVYEDYSINFNDYFNDLSTSTDRLKQAENIYLWISTGLPDQILLLFVSYLVKITDAKNKSINLIQYVKPKKNKVNFRGIGEIDPNEMLNYPKPIILSESDLDYCYQGWLAYTDKTPDKFIEYLKTRNKKIVHLPVALKNLLNYYPKKSSGLPLWDLILLEMVKEHSPKATMVIGYTIFHDNCKSDVVGDAYLFQRLHHLASLPNPLVCLSGNINQMRKTEVNITEFGEKIIKENLSSFPSNPINEWIGGVHLNSKEGCLWFNNDGILEKLI